MLAQDLQALAHFADDKKRYPALETLFFRGYQFRVESEDPDRFRLQMFGLDPHDELPIASLSRAADQGENPGQNQYWIRLDPVTLRADMASVVMTSHGFADLDEVERKEIENVVRAVLSGESLVLRSENPERWYLALDEPLEFCFTPLGDALGMDISEFLPEHAEFLSWRRIMNEIQIALHASTVNVRRRQNGQQTINSFWFWGGGFIPVADKQGVFNTVYSDNPVTRGLAIINDYRLGTQTAAEETKFDQDGQSVLVDWTVGSRDAKQELNRLEFFVKRLLGEVRAGSIELVFYSGRSEGWRYGRSSGMRFWRYRQPLSKISFTSLPA